MTGIQRGKKIHGLGEFSTNHPIDTKHERGIGEPSRDRANEAVLEMAFASEFSALTSHAHDPYEMTSTQWFTTTQKVD
jgi:hypothetical protein